MPSVENAVKTEIHFLYLGSVSRVRLCLFPFFPFFPEHLSASPYITHSRVSP